MRDLKILIPAILLLGIAVMAAPGAHAQEAKQISPALVEELLGPDAADMDIPTRNSHLALALFTKLCIDMFGDFAGVAAWADTHLEKDPGWPDSDAMRGWILTGQDTRLSLRIANGSKRFCMFGGGTVNADAAHDAFAKLRTDYAARDEHSISPNGFTDKQYPIRPSEMPDGASYYGGAVFHAPDQPGGMDLVISTKRRGAYTNLVMDIALR